MALGRMVGHSCRPDKGKNAVGIACAQGKCALFDFELAKWFESSRRRVHPNSTRVSDKQGPRRALPPRPPE